MRVKSRPQVARNSKGLGVEDNECIPHSTTIGIESIISVIQD